MTRSYSSRSTSSPLSSAKTWSTTAWGRGRLPTCVVRMRPFSAMAATIYEPRAREPDICEGADMIVRWGLHGLDEVLAELSVSRPLLLTEELWSELELPVAARFDGCQPHAGIEGVRQALELARDADGLIALGGGSVMDTAKAVSAQTGLPVVSIPTTYAGAEWTPFFGVRNPETRTKDAGFDARVEGIVYEAELTLEMPPQVTAGTALNALTHCAEALYVPDRNDESDEHALAGAALIARHLPAVLADGHDLEARRGLLEGSMHGGAALRVGMGLGHA